LTVFYYVHLLVNILRYCYMSSEVTGVNVTFHALNPFSGYLLIFQTIMEKSKCSYLPDS